SRSCTRWSRCIARLSSWMTPATSWPRKQGTIIAGLVKSANVMAVFGLAIVLGPMRGSFLPALFEARFRGVFLRRRRFAQGGRFVLRQIKIAAAVAANVDLVRVRQAGPRPGADA